MSALLAALGVGIVSYIAMMLLFPKAVPEDLGDITRQTLDRIYDENRADVLQQHVLRDSLQEEGVFARMVFSLSFMRPLYEAALQAGYQKQLNTLLVMILAVIVLSSWVLLQLGFGLVALVVAPLLGYVVPYRHCTNRVKVRNAKFIDQFPDALDIIVRSVRSGFPLSVALQMLAETTENPVREEFRQVVDDVALGRTLTQALDRLAVRINEPDIRFFVVVLSVQHETGGNLAEIIGNLSNIIRKRKHLRNKIRAMTAEGRATGWVLGLLPIFVLAALYVVQRDYVQAFWQDPIGHMMLAAVAGLIGTCTLVVKQMVNVEI